MGLFDLFRGKKIRKPPKNKKLELAIEELERSASKINTEDPDLPLRNFIPGFFNSNLILAVQNNTENVPNAPWIINDKTLQNLAPVTGMDGRSLQVFTNLEELNRFEPGAFWINVPATLMVNCIIGGKYESIVVNPAGRSMRVDLDLVKKMLNICGGPSFNLMKPLARKASRMIIEDIHQPESPLASWFGRVKVALPGEEWPLWKNEPMMPLCQFNLSELPYKPDSLADIAFITIFLSPQMPFNTPNGDGWLLRAYKSHGGLVEINEPELKKRIKPLPAKWELIKNEYPDLEDLEGYNPENIPYWDIEWAEDLYNRIFDNIEYTKIGGWPFRIQSVLEWRVAGKPADVEYVFQIGSEDKAGWQWGDAGIAYFARGKNANKNSWYMTWHCY